MQSAPFLTKTILNQRMSGVNKTHSNHGNSIQIHPNQCLM